MKTVFADSHYLIEIANADEYSLVLKETNCSDPFRVAALNIYRDIARRITSSPENLKIMEID